MGKLIPVGTMLEEDHGGYFGRSFGAMGTEDEDEEFVYCGGLGGLLCSASAMRE